MKTWLNVIGLLAIVGGMLGAIEYGVASFIGGIVSGSVFLAGGKIIELLETIVAESKRTRERGNPVGDPDLAEHVARKQERAAVRSGGGH